MMDFLKLVLALVIVGWLFKWVMSGSRAQGRARAMILTVVMLVLMALGVKF